MTKRIIYSDYDLYARKLGDRVRQGRAMRQMTQRDLANYIGVTSTQLYKYETGENRLCVVRLCLIADVLSLPISWFVQDIIPTTDDVPLSVLLQQVEQRISDADSTEVKLILRAIISQLNHLP